jgi:HD-GYP domain-containing protein (c-di-GMP phosphodiesterase class II)
MKSKFFKRFAVRLTAAIILSMMAVVLLSAIMIHQFTFRSQFEGLRTSLKAIAQTAAMTVSSEYVQQIPLNKEGINTQGYAVISAHLKKIRAANPQIKYIYVLTKTVDDGIWKFIVDEDYTGHRDNGPGALYNAGRFKEMLRGFDEPTADKKIEEDEWGKTLSGYAPIRNPSGKPIAILGLDVDAENIYNMQRRVTIQTLIILLIGVILAGTMGMLISSRVVEPVQQLIAGAAYIGQGNLHYQVHVQGSDEIAQLADAFNQMSHNLLMSRQKLVSYFFDTVKSMVKVLEVRDHYTMGHSESVAGYAGSIAKKMGVDAKTREIFHNVCLLHDIGKVGVRDSILLKPEKLNDEEWQTIQLHPVWGEQILKPILQDQLMLSVIRNHHERYDGKGYPDGLKADQIPLLVAIATVADSYDAMTSTRSYRKAMTKEQAIDQLIKGKGSQFNPSVVDAFLSILKEDGKKSS